MDFKEAFKKLGIEEYSERIFNSNSHGELFYLYDYIAIAKAMDDATWFKDWFSEVITFAENNWGRPESIFQHIPKMLQKRLAHNKSLHTDGQDR